MAPVHAVDAAGADGGDVSGGAGGAGSSDSLVLGNANGSPAADTEVIDDEALAEDAWEDYLDQLNEVDLEALDAG